MIYILFSIFETPNILLSSLLRICAQVVNRVSAQRARVLVAALERRTTITCIVIGQYIVGIYASRIRCVILVRDVNVYRIRYSAKDRITTIR